MIFSCIFFIFLFNLFQVKTHFQVRFDIVVNIKTYMPSNQKVVKLVTVAALLDNGPLKHLLFVQSLLDLISGQKTSDNGHA